MNKIEINENNGQGNQTHRPEIKEFPLVPPRFYYMLLVLPAVFCIAWLYCFYQSKTFFSTYPDSIYIYLINGTSIASGNLDIGHYDNPGTPVHILGGIIVYVVHLFAGNRLVYEDVLANPEFYLRFCAGTFGLLLLGSVYFAARFVLKHTGNFILALFFQLLPICSYFTIHYLLLVRMCPEDLIIAVLISYYAFLWVLCYKRDVFPDSAFSQKSHLFLFSFVSALLVTTKMTCLPFLIVPFFFLKNFSQKAAYVLITFVFAALMIYPIWPKLPEMYDWFTRLATHSGAYGQGQAGVSSATLIANLVKLFEYDLFFTTGYFLLSLALLVGFIKHTHRENFYKLIFAFWIICSAQLMLACKQFGYHYLIASQLLIIPGLLAAYHLFKGMILSSRPAAVLFGLCFIWFGFKTAENIQVSYSKVNPLYFSALDAKKYNTVPKIITTGYQGSCFVESAIRFGASFGGRYYHSSNYFLRKQYPNSYFYDMQLPENIIKQWDIPLSPQQFFEDKPRVLVYFVQMSREEERAVLNKITAGLEPVIKNIREEAFNEVTGERFYIIEADTAKARPHYTGLVQLDYDFEKQNPEHTSFAPATGNIFVGETLRASADPAYSGTHSIKIKAGEYSCCTTFDVNPGDAFDISVKSFSPERPVGITISGQNPQFFDHNSEAIVDDNGKGWKTIRLKAMIPMDCPERKVNFCLFYFGFKTAYADDLKIKIFRSGVTPVQAAPTELKEIKTFIIRADGGNYLALAADNYLYSNQPDASKAEVFEKVDLGNGLVAFKASNGMFVSADQNMQERLVANRKIAQSGESFLITGTNLSSVNIRSLAGTFVCADHGRGEELVADKIKASTWETFQLIKKQ